MPAARHPSLCATTALSEAERCVERANRTHTEEFYELYDGDLDLPALRTALLAWEQRYNTFRPHQALHYLTPAQFLSHYSPRKEEVSPII